LVPPLERIDRRKIPLPSRVPERVSTAPPNALTFRRFDDVVGPTIALAAIAVTAKLRIPLEHWQRFTLRTMRYACLSRVGPCVAIGSRC
jgi:hypothetical protein